MNSFIPEAVLPLSDCALSHADCRRRSERLLEAILEIGCDVAVCLHRHHVHALTGYWVHNDLLPCAAVVDRAGGVTLLSAWPVGDDFAATAVSPFAGSVFGTIVEDPETALHEALEPLVAGRQIAADTAAHGLPWRFPPARLDPILRSVFRFKDADEVTLIKRACAITDSLYCEVERLLSTCETEIDLYAHLSGLATRLAGEPLSRFGNDFQAGAIGSHPRAKGFEVGDLLNLDLTVGIRGYRSDACRTFCIGAEPDAAQREAYQRVEHTLELLEARIEPGVPCVELDALARGRLDGYRGWSFRHHLGHGIGLHQHEAPRLNPATEDRFQEGDVFTMEPGLYDERLRPGMRLEDAYYLGSDGIQRLTHFPRTVVSS